MLKYSVAILAVGLTILVRLLLIPILHYEAPFVTFYIAVLFTAWYSGFIPTVISMGASSLAAAYFFIPPINSFWVEGTENQVDWFLFFVFGFTASALSEAQKRAQHRAEVNADQVTQLNTLLQEEKERLHVTLVSIGEGVIATDRTGLITFINPVAQKLTGWQMQDAIGQPLETVFRIVNETTRQLVENPVDKVIRTGSIVRLANHTILLSRQPQETPIDDSAAPIFNHLNEIVGVILVFRDVSERKKARVVQDKHLAEIATLKERQRLARDLHDALSQVLFSSSVIAEALPDLMEKKPHKLLSSTDLLKRLNRGALAQMRVILRELSYDTIIEFRMRDLLTELADATMAKTSIQVRVEAQEEQRLPTEVHITLYRIAQEALDNIVKHSGASEALIRFTAVTGRATLRIEDTGSGFDTSVVASTGAGLQTMRECAQEIGATLELESIPQAGTTLEVIWHKDDSS